MKIFYKPVFLHILVEMLILLLSFYVVLDWLPLTTKSPFTKYSLASLCYSSSWILLSYLSGRYRPIKIQSYFQSLFKLVTTALIIYAIYWWLIYLIYDAFSIKVLFLITLSMVILSRMATSIYFAYLYAVEYHDVEFLAGKVRKNAHLKELPRLDDESYAEICDLVKEHAGEKTLRFLQSKIDLGSGNTFVFSTTDSVILKYIPFYQYSTIVQLESLNNIQGINKMLAIANEKLPDDGMFVCCYETKSTYKKRFLKQYSGFFKYFLYSVDYLHNRIYPKLALTHRLHTLITGGKNRVFSKAEILGRFHFCGYDIILEKKVGQLTYLFAKRMKQPEYPVIRTYGPLITLRRLGKDAKPFDVYKFRSMHPYSEYIQAYIYEKNNLQQGGKFHKDIRITTVGRFMRKYWLDELPMLYNLIRGQMKLVGVRPLSPHYFSLYSKDLQEKRVQHKPGLLPPFYADMPKTLEEIEQSELDYLKSCEKDGVFRTDIRYFFKIFNNIVIKKERSS